MMNGAKSRSRLKLSAVQILALGFITLISVGGLLLSLPISSVNGEYTSLIDSLFTATSAVCVTGLITIDTGTHWNTFGQIIIITLIEIGGLGFMSFTTFIASVLGRKITLRDRLIMQEAMNTYGIQGMVKMVRYVMAFTFTIQGIGAVLLSPYFIPRYGVIKGIYYSIFHSISAFCNAGFDLIGNFDSLTSFNESPIFLFIIAALLIGGGLGFTVWLELYNRKVTRKISVHTKIVLSTTVILLIGGTILIFLLEYNNGKTIGDMSLTNKISNSFFTSASPRTAGFNSISIGDMTDSSKFTTVVLMFIGGSPGSTAGGLKTTTFGLILLSVISILKGREETEAFGKRFSKELVYKAFTLLFLAICLVSFVTMALSILEPKESFIDLLYEAASAFGTAGLTTGVTQRIGSISKIILMATMYLGRVGPLTIALALMRKKKKSLYRYPEGKILIG